MSEEATTATQKVCTFKRSRGRTSTIRKRRHSSLDRGTHSVLNKRIC